MAEHNRELTTAKRIDPTSAVARFTEVGAEVLAE